MLGWLIVLVPTMLPAGEPGLRSTVPVTTRSFSGQSVLLLTNGRLVRGRVSRNSGGYVVQFATGSMVVPVSQVKMQAQTADAVYRALKKQIPLQSPRHRLALAGWCTTNELYDQALKEVRAVLKSNPDHDAARRMQTRIEKLIAPPPEKPESKSIYERLVAPEVTALAGLSPQVAVQFVSKVQPILMNSCAQSGCHGPRSKNAYRLSMVHLGSGGRRGLSEQNLSATLRFIDLKSPEQSPLLTKPLGRHGRRGKTIFRGRAGTRQLAVLRAWAVSVARSSSNANRSNTTATAGQKTRGRPQGYQLTPAMKAARSRTAYKSPRRKSRRSKSTTQKPGDPFDPAEFNRKSAGTDRRSNSRNRRGRNR